MLPDQSLQIRAFDPVVEKQPINVHYQKYVADSSSSSSVTFNVDSPFAGALLDNEVLIKYSVSVTPDAGEPDSISHMFEGYDTTLVGTDTTGGHGSAANDGRLSLKAGWAVHNSLSSINLTINGQTLTQSPRKWMGEFMRYYASPHEEKTICSLSGGQFDSGDHSIYTSDPRASSGPTVPIVGQVLESVWNNGYNRAAVATQDESMTLITDYPVGCETWYNKGFSERFYAFAEKARFQSDNMDESVVTDESRYGDTVTFDVYERVPISPFLLWDAKDGKHSIPYIDKMELDLRYLSDMTKYSLQGAMKDINNNPGQKPQFSFLGAAGTTAPELHLKWYIPPAGMVMAPQVSIPVQKIKELLLVQPGVSFPNTAARYSDTIDFAYQNIRLQQIPDLLFIYLKPAESAMTLGSPLERHLEIVDLRITVNGDSGKILQASQGRLFTLYVKNSPMSRERDFNYNEWVKRYCTVVLTPADMGVLMPPGVNHGVTLDVQGTARSNWRWPRVGKKSETGNTARTLDAVSPAAGTLYDLHVQAVYDKYELTLTNRGNAQLKLLNVPSPDIAPQIAGPDRADLAQAFS